MKIVIAGAGEVGSHLAKMLGNGPHDLTVIDTDRDRLSPLEKYADVRTIEGDCTSFAVLQEAGVRNADLFVGVSPSADQNVNIVSSLLAKQLGAKRAVARINNDEYLDYGNRTCFTNVGIDLLFYPEKIASEEIYNVLHQSGTSEIADFYNGRLRMVVLRISETSGLIGKTIGEMSRKGDSFPFKVLAVERGEQTMIAREDITIRLHDQVYVLTHPGDVNLAVEESGQEALDIQRVLILGGGRIGEFLAERIENLAEKVTIVEPREERCRYLSEKLSKAVVINSDGKNTDFLSDAVADGIDAFVAVTSSNETNIMACLAAKKLGVPKIVAEVENIGYIQMAEELGIDAFINKKLITASRVARLTLSTNVSAVKILNGTNAYALEYIARPGSPVTKAPLKDVRGIPETSIIGGVIRGNEGSLTDGESIIKPYDHVVVFTLSNDLKNLDKLFL